MFLLPNMMSARPKTCYVELRLQHNSGINNRQQSQSLPKNVLINSELILRPLV